ncbi:hypothetical protein [Ornithinimicrobium avium]|uniref:Uncharacterized protein n=1 Tax=Ornithinimicrobium avium TaxID=2283195 RepID=A0A345NK56_9MICO|nr:hypothetical protein [Ornithinimicrobium avium]AXH95414.1 hypothetical protein DV701_04075 [Ornithinimicrobium avium]
MAGQQGAEQDDERPSISELRERMLGLVPRIGTGWPSLDAISGGIPSSRSTVVRGPSELRLQVLARMAAWAAGEGYPTVICSRARTTDELWLAVGAGGLGLPPDALLSTSTHDAWVDDRLRVLDLRVLGGNAAPEATGRAITERMPALLIVDEFATWDEDWVTALDPRFGRLDLQQWPRSSGCALVLGMDGMHDFSEHLSRGVFTLRLEPDDDRTRVRLGAYGHHSRDHRTVLLRDGFLEAPAPGARYLRRGNVANTWEDRSEQEISSFAEALGGEPVSMLWEPEENGEQPPAT